MHQHMFVFSCATSILSNLRRKCFQPVLFCWGICVNVYITKIKFVTTIKHNMFMSDTLTGSIKVGRDMHFNFRLVVCQLAYSACRPYM